VLKRYKNFNLSYRQLFVLIIPLILILVVYVWFRINLPEKQYFGSDFQNYYNESIKLYSGDPIYSRILSESITIQSSDPTEKYATAFPSVYIIVGAVAVYGQFTGKAIYLMLQNLILVIDFLAGLLIFFYVKRQSNIWVAYTALIFWLFNRWTSRAYVKIVMDPIPFFFLLCSLYWFESKKKLSAGFLALSILFKHFGLFLIPFYLISWYKKGNFKEMLTYLSIVVIPLAITSLPFVITDVKGFIFSVGFNLTRQQDPDFHMPFIDKIYYESYQVNSMFSKLMIIMIGKLYFFGTYTLLLISHLVSRKNLAGVVALVFIWFFYFHSVYLSHYNIWMVGMILFNLSVFYNFISKENE